MATVFAGFTMSLDGFIANPDDSTEGLFDWFDSGDTEFVFPDGKFTVRVSPPTLMVLRDNGDGWQLFAVLIVLALLGEALTPILQRFIVTPTGEALSERVLGEVAGAVVVAVPSDRGGRSVQVGAREIPVAEDERIIIRPG